MANATNIRRHPGFHIMTYPNGDVMIFVDKTEKKNYGRPVKKQSRHGKRGLNKNGHRSNPYKKN
jgi:hypothetical protein